MAQKPKSPLDVGGTEFYPLTTADQVITDEAGDTRLPDELKKYMRIATYDSNSDGTVNKADNALTLQGQAAAYFRQKPVVYTRTFTTGGWSGSAPYSQKVNVSGLLARDAPIADVYLTGDNARNTAAIERFGNVGRIYTEAGSVTAVCYSDKPRANFTVKLMVIRGGAAK